jgi:hypothetical protein
MYHGRTHGTSSSVCEHHGHMLTVYTVYLHARIGVIYSKADAYAIGLFIDLHSGSVCIHSGSYFPNPCESLCFEYNLSYSRKLVSFITFAI